MRTLIFTFFTLLLFSSLNAQDCENDVLDDGELNIDCGGELCPFCLPLWYEITCDEEAGNFEMEVQLPAYLWDNELLSNGMIYVLSGDFTQECYDLFECQGTIVLIDASLGEFEISLYAPGFEKVGHGQIEGFAACVKAEEIEDNCPPDSEFMVTSTSVWTDSTLYMAKLEMTGGTPPYRITDNSVDKFYHTQWDEDVFYLGVIPDSVDLDVTVYDFNGCRADFDIVSKPDTPFGEDISAIENLPILGDLDIFPTIFNDYLTLQTKEQTQGVLTAFDLTGKAIATWDLETQNTQDISVGQLPIGTYVFALETNEGIYTRMAIKE